MSDEERFGRHGEELAAALTAAFPTWLARRLDDRLRAAGIDPEEVGDARDAAVAAAAAELEAGLARLCAADVDEQATTPLSLVRRAVAGGPTCFLDEVGVPRPERDGVDARLLPDDVHALGPATFAELGPAVADAGVAWGAAKAHLHRVRHGRPGAPSLGSAPVPDAASSAEPAAGAPAGGSLPDLRGVEGWLTLDQAECLWHAAAAVPPGGRIVEIGSFRGRSTIVLASAAAEGVEVVAIDPHGGGDRGPQEIAPDPVRGDADHAAFVANLERAGVAGRVRHVRSPSNRAHSHVDGPLDLLYVDGAHRFGPARHDLAAWGDRVRPGGRMLVHDAFSSIGVTLALWTTTAVSGRWRYRGRVGSLAVYERADRSPQGRLAQIGWHLAQMPWFARNVAIKVLLSVGLGHLTPLLGHRSGDWPY